MLRTLASALLILSFLVSLSAANNDSPRCNCEDEGFWSIERILECQRISDFFIAIAYFSIPIELLYFVSCSNFPFKWVLFEFIAFIVLCGMTHLLNFSTYYGQHTFQLMLSLTIFKVLTALVSFATAITLLTLFPMLLKVKVREFMLRKKTWDLGREVGLIKQQREAGWHVRMLTHEIRKSLDRHTILYTTLVELSKTLELHNCAIWKPNETKTEMNLIHQLRERNFSSVYNLPIPRSDPDVEAIKGSDGVKILDADSPLAAASSGGGSSEPGAVAAVRMPMLKVSNFKGGTPELVPECYAILVLVLPGEHGRSWSNQEIEIVRVVADQVAVALSHAAVLEESQHMRETLEDQNRALQQAKQDALKASQARNGFLMGMSHGLRRPMHSISGLHSLLKEHKWSDEQRLILDAMVKTSSVVSTLIDDVMDTSTTKDNGKFPLEMRHFQLHSMIKEAACLAKCLCACRGYNFSIQVDKSLPNHVVGDEKRVFQVILHMVGNLLKDHNGGCLTLRVLPESATDRAWKARRSHSSRDNTYIKFEVGIGNNHSQPENLTSTSTHYSQRRRCREVEESLSFNVCRKLVQLMQGDIWVTPNREGFDVSMTVVLGFQLRPSTIGIPEYGESFDHSYPHPLLQGVEVLLADYDDVNRAVTRKLLEKLGCIVSAVSSGHDCLAALGPAVSSFQIVLLDLHLPDLDGYEVTMRIRKFRSRSWPLIVGLNAAADENVGQRCIQIGMNGIIQKPAVLRGIADELQRVLLQANRTV